MPIRQRFSYEDALWFISLRYAIALDLERHCAEKLKPLG